MTAGIDAAGGPRTPPRAAQPSDAVPARMALCRHRGAPEGDHLDLFIAAFDRANPPADDDRVALSWRLPLAAWDTARGQWTGGSFPAQQTPNHRAAYLTLERVVELDRGRGIVEPILREVGWLTADHTIHATNLCWQSAANPGLPTSTHAQRDATQIELCLIDGAWIANFTLDAPIANEPQRSDVLRDAQQNMATPRSSKEDA